LSHLFFLFIFFVAVVASVFTISSVLTILAVSSILTTVILSVLVRHLVQDDSQHIATTILQLCLHILHLAIR